jgi:hypothetical protein
MWHYMLDDISDRVYLRINASAEVIYVTKLGPLSSAPASKWGGRVPGSNLDSETEYINREFSRLYLAHEDECWDSTVF